MKSFEPSTIKTLWLSLVSKESSLRTVGAFLLFGLCTVILRPI